jgi:PhzF family phenazine biosynthesis protein
MKIPLYVIDAFTEKLFSGNPAAVCPLPEWLNDDILQAIAGENNLSETAFFVRESNIYKLRWFTPKVEVSLCGHATLASAYVLFHYLGYRESGIVFETKSGQLKVQRDANLLMMDFPARNPISIDAPEQLVHALGAKAIEVLQSTGTYLAVYESESDILSITPDFSLTEKLDMPYVIVTAKGSSSDFVSRFFAPQVGISEDPVTGSAHCTLIPYWAKKLNKTKLYARQLSKRQGQLYCEYLVDRVKIGGKAVTYAVGEISI